MVRHATFACAYLISLIVVASFAFGSREETARSNATNSRGSESRAIDAMPRALTLDDLAGSWKCIGMTPTSPAAKNECGIWHFDGGGFQIILEQPAIGGLLLIEGKISHESEGLFKIDAKDVQGEDFKRAFSIKKVGPYLYVRANLTGRDFAPPDEGTITTFVLKPMTVESM